MNTIPPSLSTNDAVKLWLALNAKEEAASAARRNMVARMPTPLSDALNAEERALFRVLTKRLGAEASTVYIVSQYAGQPSPGSGVSP